MVKTVLSVKNLSKKINEKIIIHRLNFRVQSGEIYGFLGPNGSGKTTTIRMITGLIKPSAGHVTICGHDIQLEPKKALANIGAIIENPELYPYMTGKQNLDNFARMYPKKISQKQIRRMISLVNLSDAIHQPVKNYSLGMKQRLGIAQALLHQPKVLILDEPTNGLDPVGIRDLRLYLKKLAHQNDIAIIVSSHLLSEIELMCDRVLIIDHGKFITEKDLSSYQTNNSRQYTFKVSNTTHISNFFSATTISDINHFTINCSEEHIPEVIKKLVQSNIDIFSITQQKTSLEEDFINMTRGEK
ncbi:ABC transporter ATP-binding protein [Vagococcus penaei]|uniref:ABC transporter ATP-binding protein n=1 Tax=Vagococcus penaei TaxID=633807 RepID=A0A1Q2D3V1_9ENTE|nr:ABC transporter ATP-binding protein [Vagococcus penaei]AQP52981.1 ABC transporter ATP-binding protein [Vagococcus penaei]RSU02559.1 ABC transporter ATP-binding protein [Vagococcus penaei]